MPMPNTNKSMGEQRKNADAKGTCNGSGRLNTPPEIPEWVRTISGCGQKRKLLMWILLMHYNI